MQGFTGATLAESIDTQFGQITTARNRFIHDWYKHNFDFTVLQIV